jgi:hypothetical protein
MAILLHGTTRLCAEKILLNGPDPERLRPYGFSTCLERGPFPLGRPGEYARRKAEDFPEEGSPAILAVDVPDDLIDLAVDEYFPLSQGVVQFDEGAGLEQLLEKWATLWKEVRSVD